MGLDMYLTGERVFMPDDSEFPLIGKRYRLSYWRKHPNLHGYIVNHFAEGIDDCKEITLDEDRIRQTMGAIARRELPLTEGFFFGESDGSEKSSDLETFAKALCWLANETEKNVWRNVVYQASW